MLRRAFNLAFSRKAKEDHRPSIPPNDGRSRLAVITQAGREAYDQGIRIHRAAEQELFGALSPDESSALARIIEKLERARPPALR